MKKVTIDIYAEYECSTKLPNDEVVTGTITNLNTLDAFLEEGNGLYALYVPSTQPFATKRTIQQKLGVMASEALLHASGSLLTITGGMRIMNKILN